VSRQNWTREETLLAFELYCRVPFGKIHATNKDIIELANIIGRTPSSVSMKMCNLASLDPELKKRGIKGLAHRCKMEATIWEEFQTDWESLALESKEILAKLKKENIDSEILSDNEKNPIGEDKERLVKQRVGQYFFRAAVLSSYENRCCITGISINQLLIASHIKPWKCSNIKTERTNPRNGLCLNALHDKAFDQGLITINKEYQIVLSPKIKEKRLDEITKVWIVGYEGQKIILPHRFLPESQFIEYHNDVVFQR
jgi:putative restriction endonuclease